jgi:hypothetical protein
MADSLYELLVPHLDSSDGKESQPSNPSPAISHYLQRLSSLSLAALTSTEREALDYDALTSSRSLQALAKRSFRSVNTAVESLQLLRQSIPHIASSVADVQATVPLVDVKATEFAEKYSKASENEMLDRRKRILRLGTNVDKISDILELPSLLSSTIAASAGSVAGTSGNISSANANYASALDLYAHIKRLQKLYPDSDLVRAISLQAEEAMRGMTSNLITALRSQSLKLAGGMRLIALLRRVAPDLDDRQAAHRSTTSGAGEGSLGAMFLVSRLNNLISTLEALEPLRELAEQESTQRKAYHSKGSKKDTWSAGQQTERYLKRYVEIFREQCFAIISMYKSIFPASLPGPVSQSTKADTEVRPSLPPVRRPSGLNILPETNLPEDRLQQIPPALSTFTMHLVDMLVDILQEYLPNVRDQNSRDSLLTQVLYCATSLGRLGGDFGLMLAMLDEAFQEASTVDDKEVSGDELLPDPEYVQVIRKHRIQAGRLELLASGVGATRKDAAVASPIIQ